MNNLKILWIVIAIVAVVAVIGLFNGKTVTQVITDPLGAISTPYFPGPEFSINELNTYVARADFKNGTTTIVSFLNPLGATGTVDFIVLNNTGVATSTYNIQCGVGLTAGGVPNVIMLASGDVATSTNFRTIFNNVATSTTLGYNIGGGVSYNADNGGYPTQVIFGPTEYFVCKVSTYADIATHNKAFSGTNNTFDGNFKVRIVR